MVCGYDPGRRYDFDINISYIVSARPGLGQISVRDTDGVFRRQSAASIQKISLPDCFNPEHIASGLLQSGNYRFRTVSIRNISLPDCFNPENIASRMF